MKNAMKISKALLLGGTVLFLVFSIVGQAAAQTCVPPPSGLVSWWPWDGDASDIQDNNPATLFGNPSFTAGKVGQALQFDGVDDHAKVSASANLNVGTGSGLTIDTWIKPSDVSVQRPLVEWNNSVGGIGAHFWIAAALAGGGSGSLIANLVDNAGISHFISSAPGFLAVNTFQHVAVTYDKTTGLARLYLNGVVIAVLNLGIFTPQTSYDLFFGLRPSGAAAGTRYIGTMDEIEIFNRALTGPATNCGADPNNEICDIFLAGNAGKCKDVVFLIIDEDSIDNGNPPNFFSDVDVNDDIATIGLRTQLPFFASNIGSTITLHTGEVGDEGWFAPTLIPVVWDNAGPTADGLRNYLGNPSVAFPHNVGPGLGAGEDPEALLDKIDGVIPLRATGLKALEGRTICAVVYDSDISINYDDPINGSLKGDNLGTVAFNVLDVRKLVGFSSSSLPEVDIDILDAEEICEGELELFTDAPVPESSSEPFDVDPGNDN